MKYGLRQRPERLSPGSQHFRSFWGAWRTLVKFQQRYEISHRIFHNLLFLKNFRQFCSSRNWRLFYSANLGGLIPSVSCKRSSEKSYSPIMGHRTGSIRCRAEAKEKLSRIMRLSLDLWIKLYATACFEKRRSKLDLGQPPGFF